MKKTSIAVGVLATLALAGCNRESSVERSQAPAPVAAPATQTTTTTSQTTHTW